MTNPNPLGVYATVLTDTLRSAAEFPITEEKKNLDAVNIRALCKVMLENAIPAPLRQEEPTPQVSPLRVMMIRVDADGPALYLPESQKDSLWDYVQDWLGKIEIRFIIMTQAEFDALPEFDGF